MPKQGGHILAKIKFPVFSLCYINFPCAIFTQKLTISPTQVYLCAFDFTTVFWDTEDLVC